MEQVSDEKLEKLLDTHAQAWLDNWVQFVGNEEHGAYEEFADLASLLRELQQRRARRCETCASWEEPRELPFGLCRYLCDAENHKQMSADPGSDCCWWEAREGE